VFAKANLTMSAKASKSTKRRRAKGKNSENRLAKQETDPLVDQLMAYGRTFPKMEGSTQSNTPLVPGALRTVLTYSDRISISNTVGVFNIFTFSGNGLFDPNISGVGQQPLGFDQLSTLYRQYRVLGSAIEATPLSTGTTNPTTMFRACVVPSTTASGYTDYDAASSQPYCTKSVAVNAVFGIATRPFRNKMETDVIMGLDKEGVLSRTDLAALNTANPSDLWYWNILQQPIDNSATSSCFWDVRIAYLVDFFDRNLISMSASSNWLAQAQDRRDAFLFICEQKRLKNKKSRASLSLTKE
jgi:hypothetical protein